MTIKLESENKSTFHFGEKNILKQCFVGRLTKYCTYDIM